ncbi:MAG: transcriptional repressor [Pseudomonadota bacterium]
MKTAQDHCDTAKIQLTPVRKRVLEILLQEHRAMGAYEVLDMLREEGLGSQPPVAYRALDFLVSHGFVHRIERLNAFVACAHPGQTHTPAFLICTECDAVAETQTALDKGPLTIAAQDAGFTITDAVVEARGRCPKCQTAS